MLLVLNQWECTKLFKSGLGLIAVDVEGPTGRYKVDLANPAHPVVAERLKLQAG